MIFADDNPTEAMRYESASHGPDDTAMKRHREYPKILECSISDSSRSQKRLLLGCGLMAAHFLQNRTRNAATDRAHTKPVCPQVPVGVVDVGRDRCRLPRATCVEST